jgi:hypothetical protein
LAEPTKSWREILTVSGGTRREVREDPGDVRADCRDDKEVFAAGGLLLQPTLPAIGRAKQERQQSKANLDLVGQFLE